MVEIREVYRPLFPQVYKLLLELDPNMSEDYWQAIFTYDWEKDHDHCGYGLYDGSEIVGFIGLIFSTRRLDERIERFCNITSWIVKNGYRGLSLSLIKPVLSLKNYTITDMTPSSTVYKVLTRIGFKELDNRLKILLPNRILGRLLGRRTSYFITHNINAIEAKLGKNDLKILNDHKQYRCSHLLACDDSNYCYVLYNRVDRTKVPYCYIHYISNLNLFSKYDSYIRSEIAMRGNTPVIIVDSRLVNRISLPRSFDLPFRSPKLYKPNDNSIRPEQIDNLYTELVLLNLNTFPSLWEIRQEILASLISDRFDLYNQS